MDVISLKGIIELLLAPCLAIIAYFFRDHDGRIRLLENALASMATQLAVQQTLHNNLQADRDDIKQDIKEIKSGLQDLLRRQAEHYTRERK